MTADVVTGEAVALDVRLAQWPSRLVARLIDFAAQFVLYLVVVLVLSRVVADADLDLVLAVMYLGLALVVLGYPLAMETFWHGRSLGKAAMGIRVVRDDGGPERFRHALVRAVMMLLEFWGPALVASIISKRGKRLGDLLAGTIVVQERVPGGSLQPIAMPPPLAMWASTLDLSRLSDQLALSCRQFLARQAQLTAYTRETVGRQLVAEVSAAVSPPPPPGTPGWAYLSAVLAERRRREEWRLQAQHRAAQAAYGRPPQTVPPSVPPPFFPPAPTGLPPTPAVSPPAAPAPPPPPGPFAPPQ